MRPFRHLFGFLRPRSQPSEPGQNLHVLLNGYRNTALLYVAAKLKIPDLLAVGPRSSQELSQTLKAHAPTLHRVLRGLVVVGLCQEMDDGRFQLTSVGEKLRSDTGGSEYNLAILNGEEYAAAWNHLSHSALTGGTAFDSVFGESPWEHRQKNSELNQHFNQWLERGAISSGQSVVKAFDFSRHQTVVDIGGGQGALLTALLQTHRSLKGILFDQAHVISSARAQLEKSGVLAQCQCVEGDFFQAIPSGADVYILKSILHDWDDEKCLRILNHCRAAMKSGQSLLIVEKIMSQRALDRPATIMSDLHMLAVTGGMERTGDEYQKLFMQSGFTLKKIKPLSTGHSLLETVRS